MTFIDTENIGNFYNDGEVNFHITSEGHNALANYILVKMYENKISSSIVDKKVISEVFEISNNGVEGMIEKTYDNYLKSLEKAKLLSGYDKEVELKIAAEHQREVDVLKKVLAKKK